MVRIGVALAGAAMLPGCGGGTSAPAPTANEAAAGNEASLNYQAAVLDLSVGQRNIVMIRAIQDANIACEKVIESEQIKGQTLTYRAKCADGASHVVAIEADGNASVISAGAAARK
ncbi:hypothetical protein COC42_04975 [Sphingomonas spermidinifaciens]|uniref:Uncharacterized protein n=1 Tax=Sphingomonas spermidinifaciens TaxID=1141889 RepID=A0A2A4B6L2_9SPHN|nr:hypothetical protein [Sphingomonas spermidinifaciens]PCD03707.1 hypothetical protein COC42_04975 [Sphingomonas spermidinifaciens]